MKSPETLNAEYHQGYTDTMHLLSHEHERIKDVLSVLTTELGVEPSKMNKLHLGLKQSALKMYNEDTFYVRSF